MEKQYTGVILAAGRGSRMLPFSEHYPKPLLPIGNKPVIVHQIEIMKRLGIHDIVILVGHKGYEISKKLGDGSSLGVSIRYVEQTTALGIAHAVGRLETHLKNPFLLFLGDIYFLAKDVETMFDMFEEQGGGAILATKVEHDPSAIRKNYSLKLNDDGMVTRVIEKPRHILNTLKGVGLYLFDLTIFDAIRRTPRTAMRDEYEITESIQVFIDDDYPVRPANVVLDDINLTTPSDLLHCNLLHSQNMTQEEMIGSRSVLADGVSLIRTIVGGNVRIPNPISISDSVIFDDTTVNATNNIHRVILTPEFQVDCSAGQAVAQRSGV